MLRLVVRATLLLLALAALISPAPDFARAQDACAGLVEPRLEVGALGRVSSPYGVSLKDRPNTGAAGAVEVTLLPPGAVYTVIDGFRCANGYRWWQVRLASGATGWAAEGDAANYFLEPHVVGLDVFHPTADRTQITHTFVLPDGRAEARPPFPVAPVNATPAEVWQTVEIERLVWMSVTDLVVYDNGDQTQYIDHTFRCRWVSGEPYPVDGEATAARWFPADALPDMPPVHRDRVLVALADRPECRLGRLPS